MSGDGESVRAALDGRRSTRAFRPEPIPRDQLERLFATAQRAPSWCNIQPWRVWLTAPPVTAEVADALTAAATSGLPGPELPFPIDYPEPYRAHRRDCGVALYQAMGIARDDKTARYGAWLRNYRLFDAPHLAVVACDRRLGPYAILDVGVWLGTLLTTAAAMAIDTCPMASVAAYPAPLRDRLAIPEPLAILFGIALGHADSAAPANACRTDRSPLAANLELVGF
jgi:nitroreductase